MRIAFAYTHQSVDTQKKLPRLAEVDALQEYWRGNAVIARVAALVAHVGSSIPYSASTLFF
jgi:hypothetical protein